MSGWMCIRCSLAVAHAQHPDAGYAASCACSANFLCSSKRRPVLPSSLASYSVGTPMPTSVDGRTHRRHDRPRGSEPIPVSPCVLHVSPGFRLRRAPARRSVCRGSHLPRPTTPLVSPAGSPCPRMRSPVLYCGTALSCRLDPFEQYTPQGTRKHYPKRARVRAREPSRRRAS